MTVHCAYCKKPVFKGVDSTMKKNGELQNHHKSCLREMNVLQAQYAHLLLGNACKCCGSTENIHAGHINFPEDVIRKDKWHKSGLKVDTRDRANSPRFLKLIETHAVIPVCASCNQSMGHGATCRIHQKYLGIWNYLPKIDDLEAGKDFQ